MFRTSIRRKIVGIAMGLVVLMVATSVLSMVMASKVGHLLDELSNKYIPAYGHLARANIRSLERSLAPHGDGRHGESCRPAGGREQAIRQPLADRGSNS